MQITHPDITRFRDELQLIGDLLPDRACLLELGCGKAEKTRLLAQNPRVSSILALEVDEVQHAKNLEISDLPNVRFAFSGAEAIPATEASVDMVLMFKSLHHVPAAQMDRALDEIRRVLKPGGLAWLSEPIFSGDYNEILRLFHDEKLVREAAFAAVKRAVDDGRLQLVEQIFFNTSVQFRDFAQFERGVLNVTHTRHKLSPELHEEVRAKFERHLRPDGVEFVLPIRVDLLRRP